MAELSPLLNASSKDRAFALGQTSGNLKVAWGETVEFVITVGGRFVFTSGALKLETFRNFDQVARFNRRPRERVRAKLLLTQFVQGYPYQVVVPLSVNIPNPVNGLVSWRVRGTSIQSSRGVRKALTRSLGFRKGSWSARASVPRSSTLRPSPEFLQRPFLWSQQFGNPSSFTTNQGITPLTVYFREWTGTRTPGWGKKKKTNYVDNNHYVRIVQVEENRYSWYQTQAASGNFDLRIFPFTDLYSSALTPPAFHQSLAEFNALNRLISNAQQGIQANLAQNIAQVSQLSSLIVGNATTMVKALMQLKRGNIPGAVAAFGTAPNPRWKGAVGKPSVKKSIASNWLALQYGWKPLLSDIEGFLKVMGNQLGPQDHVQKAYSSATVNKQVSNPVPVVGVGYPNGRTTFSYQSRCKFVIRYRMDNPLLNLFAQTGFTNPINLFWETLPFSFVADWFLPIGSYLQQFSAWDGLTFLSGSKTLFTRLRTDSAVAYSGPHQAEPTINVQHYAVFRNEQVVLNRTALSSFPSPVIPSFNGGGLQAGVRAQNAIALLVGFLK